MFPETETEMTHSDQPTVAIAEPETKTEPETDISGERVVPQASRGRRQDNTPNKEFPPVKILDNGNGTAIYKVKWNDEIGVRHEKLVTMSTSERGRKASEETCKVFTVKQERTGDHILLTVPYNDNNGQRNEGRVLLQVNADGRLIASMSDSAI